MEDFHGVFGADNQLDFGSAQVDADAVHIGSPENFYSICRVEMIQSLKYHSSLVSYLFIVYGASGLAFSIQMKESKFPGAATACP